LVFEDLVTEKDTVIREAVSDLAIVFLVMRGEVDGVGWGLGLADRKDVFEDFH
jgi:hypothetical protein